METTLYCLLYLLRSGVVCSTTDATNKLWQTVSVRPIGLSRLDGTATDPTTVGRRKWHLLVVSETRHTK